MTAQAPARRATTRSSAIAAPTATRASSSARNGRGRVVLYTSLAPTESKPLAEAFEKKYGVKVELWRALSDQVVQRAITEARRGGTRSTWSRPTAPRWRCWRARSCSARFIRRTSRTCRPERFRRTAPGFPIASTSSSSRYNTTKVQRSQIPPRTRASPTRSGRGASRIEATDAEWMATLVKTWGARQGMAYFRKLAGAAARRAQGPRPARELVAAGEVPVGLTVYNSNIVPLKRKGAPIDFVPVQPVVARPQGIGVARNAPHPNAALLFADFVLSPEGQRLFESMGRVPASNRVKSELNNFPFTMIDPATALDEKDKWEKLWNDRSEVGGLQADYVRSVRL